MKTKELKFFDFKGLVLYIIEKLINLIQYPFIETSPKIHQRVEQTNFRKKFSQKKLDYSFGMFITKQLISALLKKVTYFF